MRGQGLAKGAEGLGRHSVQLRSLADGYGKGDCRETSCRQGTDLVLSSEKPVTGLKQDDNGWRALGT